MSAFEKIAGIIERENGIPLANITRATTIGDVTKDDLDRVSLYLDLEREFGIEIEDADMEFVGTIGEIADMVGRKVEKPKARVA